MDLKQQARRDSLQQRFGTKPQAPLRPQQIERPVVAQLLRNAVLVTWTLSRQSGEVALSVTTPLGVLPNLVNNGATTYSTSLAQRKLLRILAPQQPQSALGTLSGFKAPERQNTRCAAWPTFLAGRQPG